jgi:predicted cobalt transporter CbtA
VNPRSLLIRGMLAGLVAGVIAFVFARLFGEPSINAALAFEDAHAHMEAGAIDEPELVSRSIQASLGLAVAVCLYGAAIGGIFSLVFAFVYGRASRVGARATSATLATLGFVSVFLVPYLKYPPNPPAVGQPDTIGQRSGLYVLMIVVSVAAAVSGMLVRRSLLPQRGPWNGAVAGFATYLVIVGIAATLLPAINEVPADFSATVLWEFRVASLAGQLLLWTVIGVVFGALAERVERAHAMAQPATVG